MENSNFDKPTQVLFYDEENFGEKRAGIAFENRVICACCGYVFNLDEVEIIKTLKWVDFTEYIK